MESETKHHLPLRWRRAFAAASAALFADDVATAAPALAQIAAANPESLEARLYAAWARSRLATSMSASERDAIEHLARAALGTGESLGLPLCILGHAAVRRGDLRVARTLFRRASEAVPALVDARRGSRRVEQRLAVQRARGPFGPRGPFGAQV